MFYLQAWFWLVIIGFIVLIVGGILFLVDLGIWAWVVLGIGILLLIVGIILRIRRKKPENEKRKGIGRKFSSMIPGLAEFQYAKDKSGYTDWYTDWTMRNRARTKAALSKGYRRSVDKVKDWYADPKNKAKVNFVIDSGRKGGLATSIGGPGYGTITAAVGAYYNMGKSKKKFAKEEEARQQFAQQKELLDLQKQTQLLELQNQGQGQMMVQGQGQGQMMDQGQGQGQMMDQGQGQGQIMKGYRRSVDYARNWYADPKNKAKVNFVIDSGRKGGLATSIGGPGYGTITAAVGAYYNMGKSKKKFAQEEAARQQFEQQKQILDLQNQKQLLELQNQGQGQMMVPQ